MKRALYGLVADLAERGVRLVVRDGRLGWPRRDELSSMRPDLVEQEAVLLALMKGRAADAADLLELLEEHRRKRVLGRVRVCGCSRGKGAPSLLGTPAERRGSPGLWLVSNGTTFVGVTWMSDQLRDAIEKSGKSLNQIGKEADVSPGMLSRFMRDERTLTLRVVDRLAETLGLKLESKSKTTRRGR